MSPSNSTVSLLGKATFKDLFEVERRDLQAAILATPNAIENLRGHARDDGAPPETRFLAAELLYLVDDEFHRPEDLRWLPAVYAHALSTSEDGSPWGVPGKWEHRAQRHFTALGPAALGALLPLLRDEKRLRFTGSKRATLGEHLRVRVKDVAAYIASRIVGAPYQPAEAPEARDALIRDLEARLGARGP